MPIDYSNSRILLYIKCTDREYRYSDIDGPAHKYETIFNSHTFANVGDLIVEDDIVNYKGVITNDSQIKEQINMTQNSTNIGNVGITIFNDDNLHQGNDLVALESGTAYLSIVNNDSYDQVIAKFQGKVDGISYDQSTLSFQIKSEEITLFKNVPTIIMEEDTFQTKLVLQDAEVEKSLLIYLRSAADGTATAVTKYFVKYVLHPDLGDNSDDYWKGARVDVIDASGDFGDPESDVFAIGEFAIAVESKSDYDTPDTVAKGAGVRFNTTLDKYYTYTFIDDDSRTPGQYGQSTHHAYDMSDLLNNTMNKIAEVSRVNLVNPTFADATKWTLGAGWSIASDLANKAAGTQSKLEQTVDLYGATGKPGKYRIGANLTITAGNVRFVVGNATGQWLSTSGRYEVDLEPTSGTTVGVEGDASFVGSVDNMLLSASGKPTFLITRRPVPENADSIGRPLPIVYGKMEKMWAVWAVSAKTTRQNSISAGDDLYVIAGHRIYDQQASEILVYYGLDENAVGQNLKPGVIDFVPNPLPRSISEIDRWNLSGYNMHSGDKDKDVCPLHKLVEITTNKGDVVTAVQLRGDEYDWTVTDTGLDNGDGDLPAINGQPQFPIRYGLGNSKIYVSFRGIPDEDGSISGVPGGLIEHPVDILKHFLLNHTNIQDASIIDEQAFANAKAKLENWKFAIAITDTIDGKNLVDRICRQCKTVWFMKDGKFVLKTFDLDDLNTTVFLEEKKHFTGKQKWSRPPVSQMYNDFIFRYGFNAINNKYARVIERNKKNDQLCRDFFGRYQVDRSFKKIELPDIYDSDTANKLADHYVKLNSVTRESFTTPLRITEETVNLSPADICSITYQDPSGSIVTKTYICLSVSTKKDGITANFLELI